MLKKNIVETVREKCRYIPRVGEKSDVKRKRSSVNRRKEL